MAAFMAKGFNTYITLMGLEIKSETINRLIDFWQKQDILISKKTKEELDFIAQKNSLDLPDDFKKLYLSVNGMESLYPNEIDKEGFLFYPIEKILSPDSEFQKSNIEDKERIYLFAEYMHKSWWYGVKISNNHNYTIGIIPDKDTFKPITDSLKKFLELYLEDAPELYDYQ